MQVYIVGGAVRDQLLGRPFTDKDFVVVGATPEQMLQAGFIQVGSDFPVFLHPITKAEYALARTERKSGKGYKGFEVYAAPDVTLKEDLQRRDLTINAMAIEVQGLMDDTPINGEVIDYYGGIQDIENKVLRHVSDAFSEDPLRVLRIARFFGRFYNTDHRFSIAKETKALITNINQSHELQHLTAERVWQETSRALRQSAPQAYIECLLQLGSLTQIMPSLAQALSSSQSNKDRVFQALQTAASLRLTLDQRWCLLMTSFAHPELFEQLHTSSTQAKLNPKQLTYWSKQSATVANLLKVPKKIAQFNSSYIQSYPYLILDYRQDAKQIAKLIVSTKADKDNKVMFQLFTLHKVMQLTCQQLDFECYIKAYQDISIKDVDSSLQGRAIGKAIEHARICAIASCLKKID